METKKIKEKTKKEEVKKKSSKTKKELFDSAVFKIQRMIRRHQAMSRVTDLIKKTSKNTSVILKLLKRYSSKELLMIHVAYKRHPGQIIVKTRSHGKHKVINKAIFPIGMLKKSLKKVLPSLEWANIS